MQEKQVALFDFDGTMTKGDSIADFVRFCLNKKVLPLSGFFSILAMTLLWKLGIVAVEKVKSLAVSPMFRMDESKTQSVCRQFVKERLIPRIYPDALTRLRRHHKAGHIVLIVSASPHCYMQYLKDALPLDGIIATRADSSGQIIKNVVGEEKKRQILLFMEQQQVKPDWERSFAYGDSSNDLAMLHMTGHRFLINPKRNVRSMGNGIPIKYWKK